MLYVFWVFAVLVFMVGVLFGVADLGVEWDLAPGSFGW